jgi:pseudooxynicotine oxidase
MSYDEQDVIVVGGGLAGLTAARELRYAGRRVLVLEGRDRLGGRAFTSQFAGTEVELGGGFVHWFQPHIFAELTRYGIGFAVPPEPTRWSYISQGQVHHSTVAELAPRVSELFERCFADARATMPLPYQPLAVADAVAALDHLSMQDRLDQGDFTAEERDLLNPTLATSCSAPCADGALTAMMRWFSLPGWDFGLMLDAVGIYPLRTASLVEALAADARPEVRLSTPVAAIEQRNERVTVTARGGETFTASVVVVAVPLNTLGGIEFAPALGSEKRAVADRGQASRGVKLWAHVRGDLEPFFFMAPDDYPITFVVTEKVLDDGGQLLVAFGPDAERLRPGDDREVRRAIGERLPAGVEIVAVTGHDWWRDEFSRGTWSVFRPGQLTVLPALQARHGRVVFAGSDVADGWNGFMDGAVESGLRAARSVTQLLQPARAPATSQ